MDQKITQGKLILAFEIRTNDCVVDIRLDSNIADVSLRSWEKFYPNNRFYVEPVFGLIPKGAKN